MKLLYALVIISAAVLGSRGHGHRCPPPFGKIPFNDQEFSGEWYAVALGSIQGIPDPDTTCVKLHYGTERHGNHSRSSIKMHVKARGGEEKHPEVMAQSMWGGPMGSSVSLAVMRDSPEDKWKYPMQMSIIATDYKTYAVSLACKMAYSEKTDSFERYLLPQIWSREATLDNTIMDVLKNVVSGADIDEDSIKILDNSGC